MTKQEQYVIDRIKAGKFHYDGSHKFKIQVGRYFVWIANGPSYLDITNEYRANVVKPSMLTRIKIYRAYRKAIRKYKIKHLEYAALRAMKKRRTSEQNGYVVSSNG